MAQINFYDPQDMTTQVDVGGSGIGFYGAGGFGASVSVGAWQDQSFITDPNGTNQGKQLNNVKFLNSQSGNVNTTSGVALTAIPNFDSTVNVRFTHDSKVKTQNAVAYIYDRSDKNNPASGVTAKVAEIIHPTKTQVNNGSGDSTWITPTGSSVTVPLVDSPGLSGQRPNGASTTEKRHDYFLSISESPDSIGSKTLNGLFIEMEFLTLMIATGYVISNFLTLGLV